MYISDLHPLAFAQRKVDPFVKTLEAPVLR